MIKWSPLLNSDKIDCGKTHRVHRNNIPGAVIRLQRRQEEVFTAVGDQGFL